MSASTAAPHSEEQSSSSTAGSGSITDMEYDPDSLEPSPPDRTLTSAALRHAMQQAKNSDLGLAGLADELLEADVARVRLLRVRSREEAAWWPSLSYYGRCCFYRRVWCRWIIIRHLCVILSLPIITCVVATVAYMFLSGERQGLQRALYAGDTASFRYYVDWYQHDLHQRIPEEEDGRYPVHVAAYANQTQLVHMILSRSTAVELRDHHGWTALHYAAYNGNYEMAEALIQAGVPVDVQDKNGRSALHIASIQGSRRVVASLLFLGNANLDLIDSDGMTSLKYATELKNHQAKLLLETGGHAPPNPMLMLSQAQTHAATDNTPKRGTGNERASSSSYVSSSKSKKPKQSKTSNSRSSSTSSSTSSHTASATPSKDEPITIIARTLTPEERGKEKEKDQHPNNSKDTHLNTNTNININTETNTHTKPNPNTNSPSTKKYRTREAAATLKKQILEDN